MSTLRKVPEILKIKGTFDENPRKPIFRGHVSFQGGRFYFVGCSNSCLNPDLANRLCGDSVQMAVSFSVGRFLEVRGSKKVDPKDWWLVVFGWYMVTYLTKRVVTFAKTKMQSLWKDGVLFRAPRCCSQTPILFCFFYSRWELGISQSKCPVFVETPTEKMSLLHADCWLLVFSCAKWPEFADVSRQLCNVTLPNDLRNNSLESLRICLDLFPSGGSWRIEYELPACWMACSQARHFESR